MDIGTGLAQQAHQLGRLVCRHPAGHAQHRFPALQLDRANGIIPVPHKLEIGTPWRSPTGPPTNVRGTPAGPGAAASPTPNCWPCSCGSASAAKRRRPRPRPAHPLRQPEPPPFATPSGIGLRGDPGMGLAKYAQLQAVLELARRALGEEMARRDVPRLPGIGALAAPAAGPAYPTRSSWFDPAPDAPEPGHGLRGTLPRHPHPDLGSIPEVGQAGARPQRRGVILAPQPPFRRGGAEPRRPGPHRHLKRPWPLVDVRVLDHFIVAGNAPRCPFAERGLL